jgi:hypothetical protein
VEGEDHLPWLAALGLLNGVDFNAVQTSGGRPVEPRAGFQFGLYASPIWINGSTRQGFESEATIDVRCLSESLSNRLGDLLGVLDRKCRRLGQNKSLHAHRCDADVA